VLQPALQLRCALRPPVLRTAWRRTLCRSPPPSRRFEQATLARWQLTARWQAFADSQRKSLAARRLRYRRTCALTLEVTGARGRWPRSGRTHLCVRVDGPVSHACGEQCWLHGNPPSADRRAFISHQTPTSTAANASATPGQTDRTPGQSQYSRAIAAPPHRHVSHTRFTSRSDRPSHPSSAPKMTRNMRANVGLDRRPRNWSAAGADAVGCPC
jgi:hypothetical protein